MWIALAGQNVFSTTLGRVLLIVSIPTHYALGLPACAGGAKRERESRLVANKERLVKTGRPAVATCSVSLIPFGIAVGVAAAD